MPTPMMHTIAYYYTGCAKRVNPKYSTHNFVKYWPIF